MALPTTSNVSRPKALGYGARLDDLYLRLAVAPDRPLDITTSPLEAQKVNTASSSEDIRNEYGAIFSRSSFTGGEGLDLAHQPDPPVNASSRFWDSEHIDLANGTPGEPSQITLLPPTSNVETSASTNLYLAYDGTAIYMGEGNVTRRSADPTAATPTFADSDPGSATALLGLCSLGTDLYSCHTTNGIYRRTGGAWAVLGSTITALRVWSAKGQLLASSTSTGTVLQTVNLTSGAAITTLATLNVGQSWIDVRDCGIAILGCASDGKVYAFANNASAVLELKSQTPMPGSEVPYCVGWDGTYIFIGTREATASGAIGRVYRAELTDGYAITNLQLLRQYGDQSTAVDQAPRRIVAHQKGVVWGIYEDRSTDMSSLWRYDSASGGVSRNLDSTVTGLIVDILPVAGRLFFSVSGHGLRREQVGSYEADGYLIGPLGDLFSASPKSWSGALLDHETLPSGTRVDLYYTTDAAAITDPDAAAWTRIKTVTSGQDTAETPLSGVDARFLAGMVKIYANAAATSTPSVKGFAFKAYPGPGDIEVTLAVNTSDSYERPGHRKVLVRGLGQQVYDELKNTEGRYAELEILATGEVLRGVVKQVSTRVPGLSKTGTPSVVSMLTFRGRRTSADDDVESAFGVEEFAVMFLAGRE